MIYQNFNEGTQRVLRERGRFISSEISTLEDTHTTCISNLRGNAVNVSRAHVKIITNY